MTKKEAGAEAPKVKAVKAEAKKPAEYVTLGYQDGVYTVTCSHGTTESFKSLREAVGRLEDKASLLR